MHPKATCILSAFCVYMVHSVVQHTVQEAMRKYVVHCVVHYCRPVLFHYKELTNLRRFTLFSCLFSMEKCLSNGIILSLLRFFQSECLANRNG